MKAVGRVAVSLREQEGSALLFSLIMLAVLLFAAVALFQSTDAAIAVAGNLSFKEGSIRATDMGVSDATNYLTALTATDTDAAPQYYATEQGTDQYGIPSVDWTKPVVRVVNGYNIQYVIDRLCSVTPVTDPTSQCLVDQVATDPSLKIGSPQYFSSTSVFYRATIRATGPKNAESYAQVVIPKG